MAREMGRNLGNMVENVMKSWERRFLSGFESWKYAFQVKLLGVRIEKMFCTMGDVKQIRI